MKRLQMTLLIAGLFALQPIQAESLRLEQVLQRVVDHYPSVRSAALQVQKARLENIRVESQLSWVLQGNLGINRDTSFLGSAIDRTNAEASVNRVLENGGSLALNARISQENWQDSFGPAFPNPLAKSRLDIQYRHRFEKGAGNPLYTEGQKQALAGEKLAMSDEMALYDRLASQVIELYLATAITRARINGIDKTIQRNQRLKQYIQHEYSLGLVEEKDLLQVNARLSISEAEKKSLQVLMKQQSISLNRLMARDWQKEIHPLTELNIEFSHIDQFEEIYRQAQQHSPALMSVDARIDLANSAIRRSRDKRKDELDLVVFAGNDFNQGDTQLGSYSASIPIGGINLEFNRGLDKSGYDAEIRQAHYERDIALEDKKQILQDMQYDISSLLAEIESSEQALRAYKQSMQDEKKKLDEAIVRYRNGRIETDRIIDFEAQLATAELSWDLQSIELLRRYYKLKVLRGSIWKNIYLPGHEFNQDSQKKENH